MVNQRKIVMEKFIAYYRVSTHKQNLGLDAQRMQIRNFIAGNTNHVLLAEYCEKESGKIDNRVELSKAIKHAKEENATLLIAKLDRLSRKVSFLFTLRDSKVNFKALDLPDFNTLTLGIFSTIAQYERETISQRTKLALKAKKEQGYKLGRPNATFTEKQRNMAIRVIKEKANNNKNNLRAKLMIQSLLKETNNMSEIARMLNNNGFRTSKGKLFQSISVIRIVKRYNL